MEGLHHSIFYCISFRIIEPVLETLKIQHPLYRCWGRMQPRRRHCCIWRVLTLKAPITTIVVSLSSVSYFKSHFCKQCGPRSDCSFRSSLIWVHTVCLYAEIGLKVCKNIHSADDINRWHFQMQVFLALWGLIKPSLRISLFYMYNVCCFQRQPFRFLFLSFLIAFQMLLWYNIRKGTDLHIIWPRSTVFPILYKIPCAPSED